MKNEELIKLYEGSIKRHKRAIKRLRADIEELQFTSDSTSGNSASTTPPGVTSASAIWWHSISGTTTPSVVGSSTWFTPPRTPVVTSIPDVTDTKESCTHEWVNTGFAKTWCVHCNIDRDPHTAFS